MFVLCCKKTVVDRKWHEKDEKELIQNKKGSKKGKTQELVKKIKKKSRASPCGICGGQSGTGTVFFPEYFGFPLSISFYRYSIAWKIKKKLIIFSSFLSQGLHSKPQGCPASVASAAGPFTIK
jgi:hypothetical protein